jgi:hypothetical protein
MDQPVRFWDGIVEKERKKRAKVFAAYQLK